MSVVRKLMLLLIFGLVSQLVITMAMADGKIGPTRTLVEPGGESKEGPGRLTVASEPPGLDIVLDGMDIGKTPAWKIEVEPGSHNLRVKDKETVIDIEAGQTLKISLHKDDFIIIPQKEETPIEELSLAEKEPVRKAVPPESEEEKKKEGPSRYELFINRALNFYP